MSIYVNGKGELIEADPQEAQEVISLIKELKTVSDLHCVISASAIDIPLDEKYQDIENFHIVHPYEEGEDTRHVQVFIKSNGDSKEINIVDWVSNPFIIYDWSQGILKVFVNGKKNLDTLIDYTVGGAVPANICELKNTLICILNAQQEAA